MQWHGSATNIWPDRVAVKIVYKFYPKTNYIQVSMQTFVQFLFSICRYMWYQYGWLNRTHGFDDNVILVFVASTHAMNEVFVDFDSIELSSIYMHCFYMYMKISLQPSTNMSLELDCPIKW